MKCPSRKNPLREKGAHAMIVDYRDQWFWVQQQLNVHATRLPLLRMQSERLAQRVNLHLALRGSFENSPA